ncbi:MAG: hypothetical protein AB1782_07920 [Cyanobacteriota bacterium]
MKKMLGSNLAEYVIPIVLIALVAGLGLFYMFKNDKFSEFIAATGNMHKSSPDGSFTINPNLKETKIIADSNSDSNEEKATPETPVKHCSGDTCSIDFGNFVLTGVPNNFNDFVQASASSGGTFMMADLMKQLAQQLKAQGLDDQAENVIKLAVATHNIGAIEKEIEQLVIDKCNFKNDGGCLSNNYLNDMPKPDFFDETYNKYEPHHYEHYANDLEIQYIKDRLESGEISRYEANPLAREYFDQLDVVMNDQSIPDSMKGIIQELTWDIDQVGTGFAAITAPNSWDTAEDNDFSAFGDLKNYNASKITNFDSALICASGKGKDTGNQCH